MRNVRRPLLSDAPSIFSASRPRSKPVPPAGTKSLLLSSVSVRLDLLLVGAVGSSDFRLLLLLLTVVLVRPDSLGLALLAGRSFFDVVDVEGDAAALAYFKKQNHRYKYLTEISLVKTH